MGKPCKSPPLEYHTWSDEPFFKRRSRGQRREKSEFLNCRGCTHVGPKEQTAMFWRGSQDTEGQAASRSWEQSAASICPHLPTCGWTYWHRYSFETILIITTLIIYSLEGNSPPIIPSTHNSLITTRREWILPITKEDGRGLWASDENIAPISTMTAA